MMLVQAILLAANILADTAIFCVYLWMRLRKGSDGTEKATELGLR